jgi:hypothetical protein
MSLQKSNLAAQGFGYDMVLAISQNGLIEATGGKYDSLPGKEVSMYWAWNNSISGFPPSPSSYTDLKLPNGLDPFTVTAWQTTNGANTKISALQTAKFAMAAKGTPGIPDGVSYQDIITLNSDGTVTFTVYFLDVRVVAAIYDASGNITQYLNVAQDNDTPLSIVHRLPFKTIVNNNNLPAAVQQALGNTDISVQQLVLDFGLSHYLTGLNIPGLDQMSLLPPALNNTFGGICLEALADAGVTAFGYAADTEKLLPASLAISSMAGRADMLVDGGGKIITNPSTAQSGINTLNLYCATNGNPLPAPAQLPWNWLDTVDDGSKYDGAIAFKYGTIVNYFKSKMDTYAAGNCFLPAIPFDKDSFFFYPTLNGGQTPKVATAVTILPPKGTFEDGLMLNYGYWSPIVSNDYGDGRSMNMNSSFTLSVTFTRETITVTQQLIIHANMNFGGGPIDVDIVNKTVVDAYTIKVDVKGYLLLDLSSTSNDKSTLGTVDYSLVPDFGQAIIPDLADYVNSIVSGSFDVDPLNQLQKFIFPGGKTFQFANGAFSDFGDLVANIRLAGNAN